MGEIKSTLDLVLEKTRHLTLSEEEKRQQRHEETRKQLAGLLQRYQDRLLDTDKIGEEFDRLVQAGDGPNEHMVCEEILRRIELGGENGHWLELLQTRCRIDTAGLQSIEADFRRALKAAADRRKEEIKEEYRSGRRISGSAMLPNLDADPTWNTVRQSIAADFHHRWSAALEKSRDVLYI